MICDSIPPVPAGPGYHVYGLSRKLIERKHQVAIITRGSWKEPYFKQTINGIIVYRVRFIPIYPFHLQLHGFFVSKFLKSIESDFDLVHLHNANIPFVDTCLPKVVTEHGTMRGYVPYRKILDLPSLIVKTFSLMYIAIDRQIVRSADRVIAISKACADELRLFYGIKDLEIIHNAVDSTFFCPQNHKENKKSYILYTGRLSAEKGLIDLVKGAVHVCKKYPNFKFVIAGSGPLERRLKKLVSALNLERNFSFAGNVNHETLLKYYQNAAVYVLPSYREGLPTTLLEAMSCGLPIVATAISGITDVIDNFKTGLLVPTNSPEKLANAILTLIEDSTLSEEIATNARMHVQKYYDWDIITSKIEEVYLSIHNIGSRSIFTRSG
ncbi:MAG: glycosyltransferase family 4 protein [Candidatus Bathyarchaeia archaeon]|jgi:glycosyltransferase involved in cell wall biosynthesis